MNNNVNFEKRSQNNEEQYRIERSDFEKTLKTLTSGILGRVVVKNGNLQKQGFFDTLWHKLTHLFTKNSYEKETQQKIQTQEKVVTFLKDNIELAKREDLEMIKALAKRAGLSTNDKTQSEQTFIVDLYVKVFQKKELEMLDPKKFEGVYKKSQEPLQIFKEKVYVPKKTTLEDTTQEKEDTTQENLKKTYKDKSTTQEDIDEWAGDGLGQNLEEKILEDEYSTTLFKQDLEVQIPFEKKIIANPPQQSQPIPEVVDENVLVNKEIDDKEGSQKQEMGDLDQEQDNLSNGQEVSTAPESPLHIPISNAPLLNIPNPQKLNIPKLEERENDIQLGVQPNESQESPEHQKLPKKEALDIDFGEVEESEAPQELKDKAFTPIKVSKGIFSSGIEAVKNISPTVKKAAFVALGLLAAFVIYNFVQGGPGTTTPILPGGDSPVDKTPGSDIPSGGQILTTANIMGDKERPSQPNLFSENWGDILDNNFLDNNFVLQSRLPSSNATSNLTTSNFNMWNLNDPVIGKVKYFNTNLKENRNMGNKQTAEGLYNQNFGNSFPENVEINSSVCEIVYNPNLQPVNLLSDKPAFSEYRNFAQEQKEVITDKGIDTQEPPPTSTIKNVQEKLLPPPTSPLKAIGENLFDSTENLEAPQGTVPLSPPPEQQTVTEDVVGDKTDTRNANATVENEPWKPKDEGEYKNEFGGGNNEDIDLENLQKTDGRPISQTPPGTPPHEPVSDTKPTSESTLGKILKFVLYGGGAFGIGYGIKKLFSQNKEVPQIEKDLKAIIWKGKNFSEEILKLYKALNLIDKETNVQINQGIFSSLIDSIDKTDTEYIHNIAVHLLPKYRFQFCELYIDKKNTKNEKLVIFNLIFNSACEYANSMDIKNDKDAEKYLNYARVFLNNFSSNGNEKQIIFEKIKNTIVQYPLSGLEFFKSLMSEKGIDSNSLRFFGDNFAHEYVDKLKKKIPNLKDKIKIKDVKNIFINVFNMSTKTNTKFACKCALMLFDLQANLLPHFSPHWYKDISNWMYANRSSATEIVENLEHLNTQAAYNCVSRYITASSKDENKIDINQAINNGFNNLANKDFKQALVFAKICVGIKNVACEEVCKKVVDLVKIKINDSKAQTNVFMFLEFRDFVNKCKRDGKPSNDRMIIPTHLKSNDIKSSDNNVEPIKTSYNEIYESFIVLFTDENCKKLMSTTIDKLEKLNLDENDNRKKTNNKYLIDFIEDCLNHEQSKSTNITQKLNTPSTTTDISQNNQENQILQSKNNKKSIIELASKKTVNDKNDIIISNNFSNPSLQKDEVVINSKQKDEVVINSKIKNHREFLEYYNKKPEEAIQYAKSLLSKTPYFNDDKKIILEVLQKLNMRFDTNKRNDNDQWEKYTIFFKFIVESKDPLAASVLKETLKSSVNFSNLDKKSPSDKIGCLIHLKVLGMACLDYPENKECENFIKDLVTKFRDRVFDYGEISLKRDELIVEFLEMCAKNQNDLYLQILKKEFPFNKDSLAILRKLFSAFLKDKPALAMALIQKYIQENVIQSDKKGLWHNLLLSAYLELKKSTYKSLIPELAIMLLNDNQDSNKWLFEAITNRFAEFKNYSEIEPYKNMYDNCEIYLKNKEQGIHFEIAKKFVNNYSEKMNQFKSTEKKPTNEISITHPKSNN